MRNCEECLDMKPNIKEYTDGINNFFLCKECVMENGMYFQEVRKWLLKKLDTDKSQVSKIIQEALKNEFKKTI